MNSKLQQWVTQVTSSLRVLKHQASQSTSLTIQQLRKTLQTLQAAWGTNVTVVLLQNKGTAVSATNPLYTMTALINGTTDINGATGDLSTQSVTWNVSGTVAVTTTGTF